MLGCIAAVIETESPSQPSPAVIQRMCTSLTAGAFWVFRVKNRLQHLPVHPPRRHPRLLRVFRNR